MGHHHHHHHHYQNHDHHNHLQPLHHCLHHDHFALGWKFLLVKPDLPFQSGCTGHCLLQSKDCILTKRRKLGTFDVYLMYNRCEFDVHSVYIQCTLREYSMYIQCRDQSWYWGQGLDVQKKVQRAISFDYRYTRPHAPIPKIMSEVLVVVVEV